MRKIRRALISVYDKKGIVPFAKFLSGGGVEIISTGGTAKLLKEAGLRVKEVSSLTHFPEMLGGRVKTLHPALHAGLLAVRDNPEHVKTLSSHRIQPIDLLVVNLYPFAEAAKTRGREEEVIEMIDIGGPALLRSAAKNYRYVAAVSDPRDYPAVMRELEANGLALAETTRRRLAAKVFELTSSYDGFIHRYFQKAALSQGGLPERLHFEFEKIKDLRYGENPHQKGAFYREAGKEGAGLAKVKQCHGKELSFNNILDLNAALEMTGAFPKFACAIIKHTSPCGFAVAERPHLAFRRAYLCDPLSAFGSVIGLNGVVDDRTAAEILKSGFVECILARGFTPDALKRLETKKNLRLLSIGKSKREESWDYKKVKGGLLLQEIDRLDPKRSDLKAVTRMAPRPLEMEDLLFAFKVCRYVKSNAIVIAKKGVALGIGMGQPSRVDSCESALKKAGKRAKGAVLASDGFFPKPDSIALAKKYGIRAIIQPGGSIQDKAVIEACDRAKISMVLTGIRHFKH
ncbi:MAG: bifunctional phosphoribosylaminoimidazolecarboxamide formyltransferase/IMP cyclohydrolase [Candidatus Omnitrophica bacterium]|nr:bifunctional phosphoribosylaminoimidazolecarboxamide formyltransferase/IMP cyclohydrolase [Candidatus Omnitrophota bacterium]